MTVLHASLQHTARNVLISYKNVTVRFGDNHVLQDFNLDVYEGESLVILGASGVGKSVMVKALLKILPIRHGEILVNGESIFKMPRTRWRDFLLLTAMSFQSNALFDSLKIWQNVVFRRLYSQRITEAEARARAAQCLKQVNLSGAIMDVMPSTLSGGMQKRVGLARAIADEPKLMIFDEPTTGLDSATAGTINQLIRESVTRLKATAITITHDLTSAEIIADRVCILQGGQVGWQGTFKELMTSKHPIASAFIEPYRAMLGML